MDLGSWNVHRALCIQNILGYRIYAIKRPGLLLNFGSFTVGAYSRCVLIRGWPLIKFSPFSVNSRFIFPCFVDKEITLKLIDGKSLMFPSQCPCYFKTKVHRFDYCWENSDFSYNRLCLCH